MQKTLSVFFALFTFVMSYSQQWKPCVRVFDLPYSKGTTKEEAEEKLKQNAKKEILESEVGEIVKSIVKSNVIERGDSIVSTYNSKIETWMMGHIRIIKCEPVGYDTENNIRRRITALIDTFRVKDVNIDSPILLEDITQDRSLWVEENGDLNGDIEPFYDAQKEDVIKISRSNNDNQTFLKMDITDIVKGKKINLQGEVRLENVQKNGENGKGKLQIFYNRGSDCCYYVDVPNLIGTTKKWKDVSAIEDLSKYPNRTPKEKIEIPKDAENITLRIGLQNSSGVIYFNNIRIIEVK